VRKWLEWTPLGSLYTFSDWLRAMGHPACRYGALLGMACLGLWLLIDRPPLDEPVLALVSSAFLGSVWSIWVYLGWQNGYRRAILANMVVFSLLFLLDGELPLAQRLLTGAGFGGLVGAIVPLAFLRLRSRADRLWPRRRFALKLAAPHYFGLEDSGSTLVADCEPHEARAYLAESWDIHDADGFARTLDGLLNEPNEPNEPTIRAWNLARAVLIVRWGVCGGYLGRSKACRVADDIARAASREFTSWAEFSRSYRCGARIWVKTTGADLGDFLHAIELAEQKHWKGPFK